MTANEQYVQDMLEIERTPHMETHFINTYDGITTYEMIDLDAQQRRMDVARQMYDSAKLREFEQRLKKLERKDHENN